MENKDHLYSAWHKLKFLSQELDEPWAREMGRKLATMGKETDREFIEEFRKEILDLLRRPSNLRRIKNSLWKNYSYYRKAKGKSVEAINSPEFKRNVTAVAKELLLMERTSFEDELLFGSSPVIYREKRRMKANASEVEPEKQ
jgi:hypothetical protein